jgi:hypothetical protein
MAKQAQDGGQRISAGAHVVVGLFFAVAGVQKLISALDGTAAGMTAAILLIAGAVELVGGALVAARARGILALPESNAWSLDQPFARSATTSSKL